MKIPLTNLSTRRISDWRAVIARESADRPLHAIAWHMLRALLRNLSAPNTNTPVRSLWRRRIRHCHRCPVFDPILHACRNSIDDEPVGCGCDVVFLALLRKPYQLPGCWIDQVLPDRNLGWKSLDPTTKNRPVI